jgi:SAM-dependent methyltransferase
MRGGDHVARYRWAAAGLQGARVLDVGCGYGFGALLLRGACREYVGVDIDGPAVDWARRVVAPQVPNASFLQASQLPSDGTFGAVTCFEVLEHVDDAARLLTALQAAAAPGARIFLSTPNGSLSRGHPEWFMSPFHVVEYTAEQLEAVLRAHFPDRGEYLVQRRHDRLDCFPQALRCRLAGDVEGGAPNARAVPTPPTLRRGHALLRQVPSPAWAWRLDPLRSPVRDGTDYSHLLWVGRNPGRPPT